MKRRKFIRQTATGAAAMTILPRHVLGGPGFISPNDQINVGYIGAGKQVYGLMRNISKCKGVVSVAACDVFKQKLDRLVRSEEHTSELQSRENLVCRLLLEK